MKITMKSITIIINLEFANGPVCTWRKTARGKACHGPNSSQSLFNMDKLICDQRRQRNDNNLLPDDANAPANYSQRLTQPATVRCSSTSGSLLNIEGLNWQETDALNSSPLFLANESRLSLNSGDSVDAPLLLNVSRLCRPVVWLFASLISPRIAGEL